MPGLLLQNLHLLGRQELHLVGAAHHDGHIREQDYKTEHWILDKYEKILNEKMNNWIFIYYHLLPTIYLYLKLLVAYLIYYQYNIIQY